MKRILLGVVAGSILGGGPVLAAISPTSAMPFAGGRSAPPVSGPRSAAPVSPVPTSPAAPPTSPVPTSPAAPPTSPVPTSPAAPPTSPVPTSPAAPPTSPVPTSPAQRCYAFTGDPALLTALRGLGVSAGGERRRVLGLRLLGLVTVPEPELWQLLGGRPPAEVTMETAAAIVARLAASGLFAEVVPTLAVSADGVVVEVRLVEQPRITRIDVQGLTQLTPEEFVDAALQVPPGAAAKGEESDEDDADDEVRAELGDAGLEIDLDLRGDEGGAATARGITTRCRPPSPPIDWVVRPRGRGIEPGLLWRGVPAALERLTARLIRDGYLMVSVTAELLPDGALVVTVDEGRIGRIAIRGVSPIVEARVRERLAIRPGRVYRDSDVDEAIARLQDELPWVSGDEAPRAVRRAPGFEASPGEGGRTMYRMRDRACPDVDPPLPREERASTFFGRRFSLRVRPPIHQDCRRERDRSLVGRDVTLHLRSDRSDLQIDGLDLVRHTQVTGFAPGLGWAYRLWDEGERAHLRVDGLVRINTSRPSRPETGAPLKQIAAAERVDALLGIAGQIPPAALAEVGLDVHALTDTGDGWRQGDLTSYLDSALFNRPDREYFRRTGLTAFATAHLRRQLTLGAEYRLDRYGSLDPVDEPHTLFNRDEPGFANPGVTEGKAGSVVLRAEWSSREAPAHDVGDPGRHPERSIAARSGSGSYLTTMATLEVSRASLGSDPALRFWRAIGQATLFLATGDDRGLAVRLRGAGGADLPLQKREALGGWSALRGYGFKEFRDGDASLLGTLAYRLHALTAFVDLGAIDLPTGWKVPAPGLGAALNLGDAARLEAAWRTDSQAELAPEVRLLFGRAF